MSKFGDWLRTLAPADITVSREELLALVEKVGASLVELPEDNKLGIRKGSYMLRQERVGGFFVPKYAYSAVPLKDGVFTIRWTRYLNESEGVVWYYPELTVFGNDHRVFAQTILKALGVETHVMAFPEATVTLPVPSWVYVSSEDQWAGAYGLTVFASEAEEFLQDFISEFHSNIAAQLAPKPPEPQSAGTCHCGNPLSPEGHCWVQGCI